MRSKSILVLVVVCVLSVANIALADTFGTGANQFTIDFVDISGDTNPASGYGIVNNDYRMGIYEITNDQWNKFVNAYGTVTGSPSIAYDQSAYWTGTNVPTNYLSWYEGAQFVNWLNTSTGHQAAYKFTGTQGQSDYTLDIWSVPEAAGGTNLYRHKDAFYFLPTEDEWVKAAYWNGTNLQTWATPGDTQPLEDVEANYGDELGAQPWDVGSGSEELNGTFDMMGNVWEWMESPTYSGDYLPGSERNVRNGSYRYTAGSLWLTNRGSLDPDNERNDMGFRVATVPEPSTLLLLGLGTFLLRKK